MYFAYDIYPGILVLSIQILEQSQAYNLYLRERTISPNSLKMLTPHQGSGECSLLNIMILYIQETCGLLILKGGSFNNSI
jgi:ABC-type ATPase involved in cell division